MPKETSQITFSLLYASVFLKILKGYKCVIHHQLFLDAITGKWFFYLFIFYIQKKILPQISTLRLSRPHKKKPRWWWSKCQSWCFKAVDEKRSRHRLKTKTGSDAKTVVELKAATDESESSFLSAVQVFKLYLCTRKIWIPVISLSRNVTVVSN